MSTTYKQLIDYHLTRIRRESTSSLADQIARNHMTALRGFMQHLQLHETSPIGPELATEHNSVVKRYLACIDISERSKADRRSLLSAWRASFELLGGTPVLPVRGRERNSAAVEPSSTTPFEGGLRDALRQAGMTPKRAAIKSQVSPSALGRWTRGALPNLRSTNSLRKLEATLDLPVGHLSSLLDQTLGQTAPVHHIEYRARYKARSSDFTLLKVSDLSPEFLQSWQALLRHKTGIGGAGKKRLGGRRWTASGSDTSLGAIVGITTMNGFHYASASVLWNHVRAYYGFLRRPIEDGGRGVAPEDLQTLAWLAVPETIDEFLTFQTERSDGLRHTGHAVFCANIASLLHSKRGFLTQAENMQSLLPATITQDRSWTELCEAARDTVLEWKTACTDVSRHPEEPIRVLLEQDQPMVPVFLAMSRIRDIGNAAPSGSQEEAVARRNELLLGMLMSNPLRRKNLIELSWHADNSGNVYQAQNGQWRLRLPRSDFKNGRTRSQRAKMYDVCIAPWLHEMLDDYVRRFRPILSGNTKSDFLFLSRNGGPLNTMTKCVLDLTKNFISGCGGFGPHAFRHLVATDWLRRNPNDFLTVAELLNDSLAVVMKTYAHLKQETALARHSDQLQALLPAYLRRSK